MVIERDILGVLATIDDPEMPISIVDLGLVEDVRIVPREATHADSTGASQPGAAVTVTLLPTFVGCPALPMIEQEVRRKIGRVQGVVCVDVRFVHEPAWSVDRISTSGRESLRRFGVTVPQRGASAGCCGGGGEPGGDGASGSGPRAGASSSAEASPSAGRSNRDRGIPSPGTGPGAGDLVQIRVPPATACPFCGSEDVHLESAFGPTRCRMIYYCRACKNPFEHMKRI